MLILFKFVGSLLSLYRSLGFCSVFLLDLSICDCLCWCWCLLGYAPCVLNQLCIFVLSTESVFVLKLFLFTFFFFDGSLNDLAFLGGSVCTCNQFKWFTQKRFNSFITSIFSLPFFSQRERERDSRLRHISLSIFSCVFVDSFIFPQRKQFTLFSPKFIFIFEIPIHNCFSLIWCSDLTKAEWLRS